MLEKAKSWFWFIERVTELSSNQTFQYPAGVYNTMFLSHALLTKLTTGIILIHSDRGHIFFIVDVRRLSTGTASASLFSLHLRFTIRPPLMWCLSPFVHTCQLTVNYVSRNPVSSIVMQDTNDLYLQYVLYNWKIAWYQHHNTYCMCSRIWLLDIGGWRLHNFMCENNVKCRRYDKQHEGEIAANDRNITKNVLCIVLNSIVSDANLKAEYDLVSPVRSSNWGQE